MTKTTNRYWRVAVAICAVLIAMTVGSAFLRSPQTTHAAGNGNTNDPTRQVSPKDLSRLAESVPQVELAVKSGKTQVWKPAQPVAAPVAGLDELDRADQTVLSREGIGALATLIAQADAAFAAAPYSQAAERRYLALLNYAAPFASPGPRPTATDEAEYARIEAFKQDLKSRQLPEEEVQRLLTSTKDGTDVNPSP